MNTIQTWATWLRGRVGLVLLVALLLGCGQRKPAAGPPRFFVPIVAQVEVDHRWYWRIMYSRERYGIYIRHSYDNYTDSLFFPPVPLWVTPEVAKRVAAVPFHPEGYKQYFDKHYPSNRELHERLKRFIERNEKTTADVEKVATLVDGFRFNETDWFSTRLLNGAFREERHTSLGADSILVPNRIVRSSSFSYSGRYQYLFRGKPLLEQDLNDGDWGTQHGMILYDGDYVVFWDYPYTRINAEGKPTWRWYVLKVPKDDPTWFDPEWVKAEIVVARARKKKEYSEDSTGIFTDGNPRWKVTEKYIQELEGFLNQSKKPTPGRVNQ